MKALPSSWQSKVTPASLSEKTKLALVASVGFAGPLSIEGAGGGVRSIVHEKVAVGADDGRPDGEDVRALAERAIRLGGRAGREGAGVEFAPKRAGVLFELNLKLAPVWFVGFGGVLVIVTTGLTVSTSQE